MTRPLSMDNVRRWLKPLIDVKAEPSVQSIPTTIAGINALSGTTFTEWYVASMASGNLVGAGGTTLTASGAPRYACTWPGWNGTDMTSGFRAVEFDGSTASFASGSTTLYNIDASVTFVFCVRVLRPPGITSLFSKKATYATADKGYVGYFNASGDFVVEVSNGSSQVLAATVATAAELDSISNGAPHWIAVKFNLTSGEFTVYAYGAAGTAVSLPAGDKTTTSVFKLGYCTFLNSPATCQILAFGVLTGANAESFGLTQLNAIDGWCEAHASTTYVRQNCVSPIVGVDSTGVRVQHCHGSASTTALTHVAHAYSANCTAPGNVGVLCERGLESLSLFECRNRLLNTDDLANASFTKTNITATTNNAEDPSGFLGATRLTASAGNGICYQNFTGEANNDHSVSVFAKRNQGTDVAARLQLVNSADSTEIAGTDITITSTWQRYSLTVPAASVTVATLRWQIRINTNGDSIHATFAQAEYGWVRQYQPQRAALLSRDQTEWTIDNSSGQCWDVIAGRAEVTCTGLVATVNSTGAFIFSTDAGASNEDRLFMQRDALTATYDDDTQHYDSAGVLVAQMSDQPELTHTNEIVYAYEFDSRRPIRAEGGKVRTKAECGGSVVRSGAVVPSASWTTSTNADRIFLGMRHSFSAHLEGIITRFRSWGRAT